MYKDSNNNGQTNMAFGAYGDTTPPLPVLEASNALNSGSFFGFGAYRSTWAPVSQLLIQDIDFTDANAPASNNPSIVSSNHSNNITMRNCQFYAVNYVMNAQNSGINMSNNGIMVQNCTQTGPLNPSPANDSTLGLYAYLCFDYGGDAVVLGNTASSYNEHDVRAQNNFAGLLVADNQFYDGGPGGGTSAKCDVRVDEGSYAYIASNVMHSRNSSEYADLSFSATTATATFNYGVIENNYFDTNMQVEIERNVSHVAFQNNVIHVNGSLTSGAGIIEIAINPNGGTLPEDDIRILNNTIYSTGNIYPVIAISTPMNPGSPHSTPELTLENNLFYDPGLSGEDVASAVSGDQPQYEIIASYNNFFEHSSSGTDFFGSTGTIAGWDGAISGATDVEQVSGTPGSHQVAQISVDSGGMVVSAPGVTPTETSPTDFAPTSSYASEVNVAVSSPYAVTQDFYGTSRLTTAETVGAVQILTPVPTNLTVSDGSSGVALNWAPVPANGAGLSDIMGYNVYRLSSLIGSTWTLLNTSGVVTAPMDTDTAPPTNTAYYYKVTAVDVGGNESTASAAGTTTGPDLTTQAASGATPLTGDQNYNDPNVTAAGGIELGMTFSSLESGYVNGVEFWKGTSNTGVHTGELWDSTGHLLATAAFTNETSSGWQEVNFATPVHINANTTYIISYHTTSDYYAYANYTTAPTQLAGPLQYVTFMDVYSLDNRAGTNVVPTTVRGTYAHYWVDVAFTPSNYANLTAGSDSITLSQNADHATIHWSSGTLFGDIPISDALGLVINGISGSDTINLDYTNGNPLPNNLALNGLFTLNGLSGTNPLGGTTLNINRSTLYISYTSSDPLASIQAALALGYNAGAQNGVANSTTGAIESAPANSSFGELTEVGYIDSADGTGWNTVVNSIELKYALQGDTDLNGTVDFSDFMRMTQHYTQNGGATWDEGDFNYDGSINTADFNLLDPAYGDSINGR